LPIKCRLYDPFSPILADISFSYEVASGDLEGEFEREFEMTSKELENLRESLRVRKREFKSSKRESE